MRLELLARVGELRRFEAGSTVFRQGEPGDEMFVILAGKVRIESQGRQGPVTLEELESGSIFGEMSLLERVPRSASAIAVEPTTLIAIREDRLRAAIAAEPELAMRMLRALSARVRRLEEMLLAGTSLPSARPLPPLPSAPPGPDNAGAAGLPREADAPLPGQADHRYVFAVEVRCPVCKERFSALQVRTSRLQVAGRDLDLRTRYREFDPLWYQVWVCPHCRYAALRSEFQAVGDRAREALAASRQERLAMDVRVNPEGGSPRTAAEAVGAVLLALHCAETAHTGREKEGRLWLYLAWMWEELHQPDEAARARRHALQALQEAYERSRSPEQDQRLAYLVGILHLQCGDPRSAHAYLLKAIDRKSGSAWLNARAREVLASLRSTGQ